jgi:hypothetical protein
MNLNELAPVIVAVPTAVALYIYLLVERRKVIAARERRRQHPAE